MTYYDDNELISFPLLPQNDNQIPSDVFVDTIVHAPSSLGNELTLRSISITGLLVSCVLSIGGTDVAYVTAPLTTVVPHEPVSVTAIVSGVSGFVVFGFGITRQRLRVDGTYVFQPECLVSYVYDTVNSTLEVGGNQLFGLVKLTVGEGLALAGETLLVRKEDLSIVSTLAGVISVTSNSLYSEPVPGCLKSAEGTPDVAPIRAINEVVPDCAGNIDLTIVNVREVSTDSGIVVAIADQGIVLKDEGEPCES